MAFAAGLDVGADAAVPEQVDRRPQNGIHQLGRAHLADFGVDAQRLSDFVAERYRLERARVDAATCGNQAAVVIVPARARQLEQVLTLAETARRIRRRIDEDMTMVACRNQRSEEHTSELQSLLRISSAVLCL